MGHIVEVNLKAAILDHDEVYRWLKLLKDLLSGDDQPVPTPNNPDLKSLHGFIQAVYEESRHAMETENPYIFTTRQTESVEGQNP